FSEIVGLSIGEKHFIQGGIAQDIRTDGRKRLTYHPLVGETGVIAQANSSARVKIRRTKVIVSVKDFKINTLLYVSSDFSVQFSAPDLMKGIKVIRANRRTGHEADLIIDEHAFKLSCSPFMFVLLILLVDIINFKEEAEEHLQDAILENFAAFGDVCLGMGGRRHSVHLLLKVVVMQSVLELEAAQGGCCAKCIGTRSGFKARRVGIYELNKKSPNVNTESSAVKKSKAPMSNTEADSPSLKKKDKHRKGTESVKFRDVQPPPKGVDLNVPYFGYEQFQTPFDATKGAGERPSGTNKTTADGVEKKKQEVGREFLNEPLLRPVAPTSGSPLVDHMNNEPLLRPVAPISGSPLVDHMNQMRQYCQDRMAAQAPQVAQVAAEFKKVATDSCRFPSWTQGMLNATNQCPFTGMPLQTDSDSHGNHHHSRGHHWKRHGLDNNGIGTIFHRGVRKDDYDLCGVCFARMGTASDYVRIDRPMHVFRHHVPFKGFYDPYMADDHPENEPWHGVDHRALKPNFDSYGCDIFGGNYTINSTYRDNLNTTLFLLPISGNGNGFYRSNRDVGNETIYSVALCRGDVDQDLCGTCVNESISKLQQICPNQKSAIGYYEYCMLKYSNSTAILRSNQVNFFVYIFNDSSNASDPERFYNGCTPDLSKQQCGDCLNEAVSVYMTQKCGVSRLENISSHV
ncbi:PB1 domain-containing protein, partial [Tanacetum coccineum]